MRHWRWYVLAALAAAPILVLLGLGAYHVAGTMLGYVIWWSLAGIWSLTALLAWRWHQKNRLLPLDFAPPVHWTERDRQAWHLVEARAKQAAELKTEHLTSLAFFQETGESLALELARFYHPGAEDPVGSLTIPEILAVIELAARDLAEMVDVYLPGGHLFTINDLRRVQQAAGWYPAARNLSWLISGVFAPLNTAVRFLAARGGMDRPWQLLQENALVWFFTAYLHRLGSYLIDLNSGRLRVGAERYRRLQKSVGLAAADARDSDPADAVRAVVLTVIGQSKMGKSSVINGLLGGQRARTDVLPATAGIERYELQSEGVPTRFEILDTVGYGHAGPREDQKRTTEAAARQSDVILLVLHARNPARQGDLDLLQDLQGFFAKHPDLHKPPVLAVLTHIDLLTPALEWAPPYDWRNPQRPKEQQIAQALAAVSEQLGPLVAGVVPVCTAPGKAYGVQEWLLPALVGLLDQAHAVALLRCLKAEADKGKIIKVFHQLLAAGKSLFPILWHRPIKAPPASSAKT